MQRRETLFGNRDSAGCPHWRRRLQWEQEQGEICAAIFCFLEGREVQLCRQLAPLGRCPFPYVDE